MSKRRAKPPVTRKKPVLLRHVEIPNSGSKRKHLHHNICTVCVTSVCQAIVKLWTSHYQDYARCFLNNIKYSDGPHSLCTCSTSPYLEGRRSVENKQNFEIPSMSTSDRTPCDICPGKVEHTQKQSHFFESGPRIHPTSAQNEKNRSILHRRGM